VKGLEKLSNLRVAEVLSHHDVVASEKVTDALYHEDRSGLPFVDVLVDAGYITEWELAKQIAEHFNLPFLLASSYQIAKDSLKVVPEEMMLEHNFLPLDVFNDILTISMPIMLPFEVLKKIGEQAKLAVYPCVGLISENRRVLHELFPGRQKAQEKRGRKSGSKGEASWLHLFDQADQRVNAELSEGP
jgi:hypothetical protein